MIPGIIVKWKWDNNNYEGVLIAFTLDRNGNRDAMIVSNNKIYAVNPYDLEVINIPI